MSETELIKDLIESEILQRVGRDKFVIQYKKEKILLTLEDLKVVFEELKERKLLARV